MQEHKHVFTPLDKVVIEAGEAGGVLTESFASLHAYYKQQYKIKKFLWQASLYPSILLGFSLAALLFFVIKIVPMFSDLYTSFAVEQTARTASAFYLAELCWCTIIICSWSEYSSCVPRFV
jgi:type II secretory pathway component PulF